MRKLRRYFWPTLSAVLLVLLLHVYYMTSTLREHDALCTKALVAEDILVQHTMQTNLQIEAAYVDTMQRLGLDQNKMPLMATMLWREATGDFKVSAARRLWKAPSSSSGFLKADMDNPPIGGEAENVRPARHP